MYRSIYLSIYKRRGLIILNKEFWNVLDQFVSKMWSSFELNRKKTLLMFVSKHMHVALSKENFEDAE